MKHWRTKIAESIAKNDKHNYHENGWKTCCTSAVLGAFQIDKSKFRYCHTTGDVLRILRNNGFSVRSRGSLYKGKTLPKLRGKIKELGVYVVYVKGHVLLVDHNANVIVDTDPRKRECRKILGMWRVTMA